MRPVLFYSNGIFVLKFLTKHAIFLIGWLGIRMNLKLIALFPICHPLASLLMPLLCVIFFHCSDHDSSSCPYYISDEGCARLSSMIKTMNKQRVEFEIKMREFDLSHEIDLRFSSPKLDVCLCDDGASLSPLESGLVRLGTTLRLTCFCLIHLSL